MTTSIFHTICTATLTYCMLVSVTLILSTYILLTLPLRLVNRRWDYILQEICQGIAIYAVLGVCGFPVDSKLVLSLPEDEEEQIQTYAQIRDGYDFDRELQQKLTSILVKRKFTLPRRRDIIIANHQIYVDWLYIWSFAVPLNRAGSIKIILKRSLLFAIPVLGIAMKVLNFIFLHRNWEIDRAKFGRRLQRLAFGNAPFSLVIFPEGTIICAETQSKSHAYADKNNLPHLQNVLLPRVTGMQFALDTLNKSIDGIFDLTIGYEGVKKGVAPEEIYGIKSLFIDRFAPPTIHVHVRYHPLTHIPYQDAEKFSQWLVDRFEEKEQLLDCFYRKGCFPGPKSKPRPVAPKYAWMWCLIAGICSTYIFWYAISTLCLAYLVPMWRK